MAESSRGNIRREDCGSDWAGEDSERGLTGAITQVVVPS